MGIAEEHNTEPTVTIANLSREQAADYLNGYRWQLALWDVAEMIRRHWKYPDPEGGDPVDRIYQEFHRICLDNGLDITSEDPYLLNAPEQNDDKAAGNSSMSQQPVIPTATPPTE